MNSRRNPTRKHENGMNGFEDHFEVARGKETQFFATISSEISSVSERDGNGVKESLDV